MRRFLAYSLLPYNPHLLLALLAKTEMSTLNLPDVVPSPTEDCETLQKAFKGWGTDEKSVIQVLGRRTADQRRFIRELFCHLYSKSLLDELDSELSGDFGNAVMMWTTDPAERDARMVNEALREKNKGIKHLYPIIEIACASSPHHLIAVRRAYFSLYDCSLEEDIGSALALPLPIRKLLVGLVSSYRYDKEMVRNDVASSEAARLYEAIVQKKLDDDDVVRILSTRNVFQLRSTFNCYQQQYGNPIDEDIKSCGDGDLESLLRVVVSCLSSPERHFAEVIRTAVVGLGTDDKSLIRAIITRAEVDMKGIQNNYLTMYKVSLEEDVIGDTSGDYKKFLLTLLGARV